MKRFPFLWSPLSERGLRSGCGVIRATEPSSLFFPPLFLGAVKRTLFGWARLSPYPYPNYHHHHHHHHQDDRITIVRQLPDITCPFTQMIHAVGITTRRLASSCRVSPATLAGSCLRHPQHPSATVLPRHDTVLASALPSPAFRQPYSSTVAAATSDASTSEDSHQPRRNRLSHQVCVELRGLPSTATPSDIRRLSADIKTSNDIFKIELLRTIYLNPSGKALVYFTSETHAKYFHASASRRIVGGHQIHAHLLSR